MPSCIICHLEIVDGLDVPQSCPNDHNAHEDCLKEWLCHSLACPLCSTQYSINIIEKFKGFLEKKEQEKQTAFNDQLLKENMAKIEKIAEKMVFLKFVEVIENLVEGKEYDSALERLLAGSSNNISDYKGQTIMFLQGKINFLKGRYDLAINFLFKLVKEKFDYPEAFMYLGKAYQELGLEDKARWAFERAK